MDTTRRRRLGIVLNYEWKITKTTTKANGAGLLLLLSCISPLPPSHHRHQQFLNPINRTRSTTNVGNGNSECTVILVYPQPFPHPLVRYQSPLYYIHNSSPTWILMRFHTNEFPLPFSLLYISQNDKKWFAWNWYYMCL